VAANRCLAEARQEQRAATAQLEEEHVRLAAEVSAQRAELERQRKELLLLQAQRSVSSEGGRSFSDAESEAAKVVALLASEAQEQRLELERQREELESLRKKSKEVQQQISEDEERRCREFQALQAELLQRRSEGLRRQGSSRGSSNSSARSPRLLPQPGPGLLQRPRGREAPAEGGLCGAAVVLAATPSGGASPGSSVAVPRRSAYTPRSSQRPVPAPVSPKSPTSGRAGLPLSPSGPSPGR